MKRPRNGKEVAEKEKRKKARVVQTTYIGRLKDWKRDGVTQINISGDCEDVCVISTYKEGKREGLTYSFYKQTGRLIHTALYENDRVVQQMDLLAHSNDFAILDSPDGSRWEGQSCLCRSCGQGEEYDKDNNLIYRGMEVNSFREGVGTSYFPYYVPPQIEYEGEWSSGLRQGEGTSYDRLGKLIYKGKWFQDEPAELSKTISDDSVPIEFSTYLEELIFGDFSCNSLSVIDLSKCENLKRFVVGKGSCHSVKQLEIRSMRALEEITVNADSFSRVTSSWESHHRNKELAKQLNKQLIIAKNPKLRHISLGKNSFSDFIKFEITGKNSVFKPAHT